MKNIEQAFSSRRGFIGGFAALSGLAGCRLAGASKLASADLKFGVLSDVHLHEPGDEDTLLAAFAYFRDQGADGVIIAGDIANTGKVEQLKRCADAWYSVFPGDRSPDGRHVEKLFVYGNHDVWGGYWNNGNKFREDSIYYNDRYARIWEGCFHEPYSDFWIKNVKGFTFIGGHWTKQDQFDGLGAFIKAHEKEIDMSRPFFYTQHSHPKDTCIGPWAWGRDNGASTAALSKYPNAVAFSGHSHYALTDERTIWQGAFTSINTASLRYCSFDYSLRENINGNAHGYRGEKRKHQMDQVYTRDGRHGMLVSVYGSTLVIERREFVHGKSLGDDWVIQVPCTEDRSFATRAKERSAPEFASGAKLGVAIADGKVNLSFPAARTVRKCRVFEYEVTATLVEDEVDLVQAQRRVMATDFYQPETPAGAPGSCVFSLAELPNRGHYVFSVRPMDCFGLKGAPISAAAELPEDPPAEEKKA